MMLLPDFYVPSVRWRQAEYQALMRLSDAAKIRVVPLIVVPKPEYDFEKKRMKRTVQEQVEPFAKQYNQKWGKRPAWIDIHPEISSSRLTDGKLPLAHVLDALAELGSAAVPALALGSTDEIKDAAKAILKRDGRGAGLRIRIEDMMRPGADAAVKAFLAAVDAPPSQIDLIVDLGAPNYEPYDDFCDAFIAAQQNVGDLTGYRSFVLLGTAFPASMSKLERPGGDIPRHDWNFYTALRNKLPAGSRVPNYGDYTTVPPSFSADLDFRKVNPAGKLVYTCNGVWMIRKGGAFRNDRAQMHEHCDFVRKSGKFRGEGFSDGDAVIQQCGTRRVKPTNSTRWKEIGISHHIMHVLDELATPAAPT